MLWALRGIRGIAATLLVLAGAWAWADENAPDAAQAEPPAATTVYADQIIPLREITPGMKGIAKTVFFGTEVEDFEVEVIDVVRNIRAGRDAILVRSSDPRLVAGGIAQGMSGSPVYIDGKLAGAISFTFPFSKEPIGGVTPIEEMLPMLDRPDAAEDERNVAVAGMPDLPAEADEAVYHRLMGRELAAYYERTGTSGPLPWYTRKPRARRRAHEEPMQPITTPVWVRGVSGEALSMLRDTLAPFQMMPLASGGAGGAATTGEAAPDIPTPGGVVGLRLADGAVDVTAVGTLTARFDDKLLAFGHGVLNAGNVDFTMTGGKVHTIVPSVLTSFKIGTATQALGHFAADTPIGLMGRLGKKAPMIPVTFNVAGDLGKLPGEAAGIAAIIRKDAPLSGRYTYRVTEHPDFASRLIPIIALELAARDGRLPVENTIHFTVQYKVKGYPPIEISDYACGPQSTSFMALNMMAVAADLLFNPFEDVEIEEVSAELAWRRGMERANIREIRVLTEDVRPGKPIDVEVTLMPFRSALVKERLTLTAPRDTTPGLRYLIVGDAATAAKIRAIQNLRRAIPQSVAEYIDLVNTPRHRRRLTAWLVRDDVGIAVEKGALPNLPASTLAVLADAPRTGLAPLFECTTTSRTTPYVIVGQQTMTVHVREDEYP